METNVLSKHRQLIREIIAVCVLFGYAVSQPLYDLMGRHLTFLVAHHIQPADIFSLVLMLSAILPLLLALFIAALRNLSAALYRGIHLTLIFSTVYACVMPILKRQMDIWDGWTGLVLAAAASVLYQKQPAIRKFLLYLAPAVIVFPIAFLMNSGVRHFWQPDSHAGPLETHVENPHPVVWMVYDELPVSSLMDEHYLIDSGNYPNFAELARDSTWFRNTVTPHASTDHAVTSMLSGLPDVAKEGIPFAPVYSEYPVNVFSLLGRHYEMNVLEGGSHLCPDSLCVGRRDLPKYLNRMDELLKDLGVIYAHLILPKKLSNALPRIDSRWHHYFEEKKMPDTPRLAQNQRSGFLAQDRPAPHEALYENRYSKFLERITASSTQTFHFLKSIYPHVPWRYFPSGRLYSDNGSSWKMGELKKKRLCPDDVYLTNLMYTRHLLQSGYADRRLGQVIGLLKKHDLYEPSLIIVTADHGVSFEAGREMRLLTKANAHDMTLVPLFIKRPFQKAGIIRDDIVSTVDILPTLLDVLGSDAPADLAGHSLFRGEDIRRKPVLLRPHHSDSFELNDQYVKLRDERVRQKIEIFGSGLHPLALYKNGPHPDWIGKEIPPDLISTRDRYYKIDNYRLLDEIDLTRSWIPAFVDGRMTDGQDGTVPILLAIAVNGRVAATARTYLADAGQSAFQALIPEEMMTQGFNQIDVYEMAESEDKELRFYRLFREPEYRYRLMEDPNAPTRRFLLRSDGKRIPIHYDEMIGTVRESTRDDDHVVLVGWLLDLKTKSEAESLLIFRGQQCIFEGQARVPRTDVREVYGASTPLTTGFRFSFGRQWYDGGSTDRLTFVALSKRGVATEMKLSHF